MPACQGNAARAYRKRGSTIFKGTVFKRDADDAHRAGGHKLQNELRLPARHQPEMHRPAAGTRKHGVCAACSGLIIAGEVVKDLISKANRSGGKMSTIRDLQDKILQLKKEKGVSILAHSYQAKEIIEVADVSGDSFQLSLAAQKSGRRNRGFMRRSFYGRDGENSIAREKGDTRKPNSRMPHGRAD